MYDLIVIGGGPAGSSAAITAARSGARVLLLERGRFPRQKVCGEFVSAESLGLLENMLDAEQRPLLGDDIRIKRTQVFINGRELRAPDAAASIARLDGSLTLECGPIQARKPASKSRFKVGGPIH
jgi:flavin-dependent dehydrogenase